MDDREEESPLILNSARKHGIKDADMRHAFRQAVRVFDVDEDLTMYVGPSLAANFLEVGVADSEEGPVIVHAMPAREKFLRWR